jgi:hypothetical protein
VKVLGDIFNNNRKRDVVTREGQRMFMGKKYSIEPSGYYMCTSVGPQGHRKRLHDVMWEEKWGLEVPKGCVIHHLDWNKSNNTVENLVCLTCEEHERVHNIVGGEAGKALGYELVKTRDVNGLPPNVDVNVEK